MSWDCLISVNTRNAYLLT